MTHGARILWKVTGDFAAGTYSRAHEWHFDGGAVIRASSSPSVVPVPLSDVTGVDPEEAFVASLSSCHMLWFLDLARRAGFVAESYLDAAEGKMAKQDGKLWISVVTLRPRVTWAVAPSREREAGLHHAAHKECFIANSVKTEIRFELED